MGRGTLEEVWDGLGPSGTSGTGRGTLCEAWDGSRDPLRGPGRVRGPFAKPGTG